MNVKLNKQIINILNTTILLIIISLNYQNNQTIFFNQANNSTDKEPMRLLEKKFKTSFIYVSVSTAQYCDSK